jgi:hypothetical protein
MASYLIAFATRGKIGLIRPDGTGERFLEFDVPGQVSWQLGPQFHDGRLIVTSFEQGKTWEGNVRTHLWIYAPEGGTLTEIATRDRLAPFLICSALLPGEERMVANPIIAGEQRLYTMNLDGSDPVPLTQARRRVRLLPRPQPRCHPPGLPHHRPPRPALSHPGGGPGGAPLYHRGPPS